MVNTAWWIWGVWFCVSISVWLHRRGGPLRCAVYYTVHNTGFPPLSPQLENRLCYLDTLISAPVDIWLMQPEGFQCFHIVFISLGERAYHSYFSFFYIKHLWILDVLRRIIKKDHIHFLLVEAYCVLAVYCEQLFEQEVLTLGCVWGLHIMMKGLYLWKDW